MSKEEIKQQLRDYEPTPEETVVIKSAVLNFFSLTVAGAGWLGMAGHMWSKSRQSKSRLFTMVGALTGLALGGALGVEKTMRTLRTSLPEHSELRRLIQEYDCLRQQKSIIVSYQIDQSH